MSHWKLAIPAGLISLVTAVLAGPLWSQQPADRQPVTLVVRLPAEAGLEIDGYRTKSTGSERWFRSPPIPVGGEYLYTLKATWKAGSQDMVASRQVRVRGGQQAVVDLREADMPSDTPEQKVEVAEKRPKRKKLRHPDVIFVPTPQEVVDKMLELAEVKKGDVVYDLGCGDGRIPVTAAKKFGCRAFGFDIDPDRIEESLENVRRNQVENLVTIQQKDIFTLDLRDATVVTLYLLPELNVKLIPQLEKMKPGTRIVSHDFEMEGVKPDKVIHFRPQEDDSRERPIYLWTIPLKKENGG
jgi:uncharacterized protein (TIGR03000 family)